MESREKLYYLLYQYVKGNYNTEIFSDKFTITYYIAIPNAYVSEKEIRVSAQKVYN
jgi:hypothetical protein